MAVQHFKRRGGFRKPRERKALHRINGFITAKFVRIVGDNVGDISILSTQEAIKMAEDMELDLVEISPTAEPPVCKLTDYQKFLYQQKKKLKEQKAKATKVIVKEIRFGPNTDEHDYNFKLKHAIKFLEDGAKVKAYVFFKGRSIIYKEQGNEILEKFSKDLEEYGKLEQRPKLEGKRMIIFIAPHKVKKN